MQRHDFQMSTFKQIFKEFWLPFALSVAWTLFVARQRNSGTVDVVTTFGAAFFLCSWATGQFFRINKQLKVEERLSGVGNRLEGLADQIEARTQKLMATISGGDSFCQFGLSLNPDGSPSNCLFANHHGEHPLYGVSVRVVDLDELESAERAVSLQELMEKDYHFELGDLIPEHAQIVGYLKIPRSDATTRRLNIFWSARNGGFSQTLRYVYAEGEWHCAARVRKNYGAKSEMIFEKIDEGYPLPVE